MIIHADPGESLYSFFERVLKDIEGTTNIVRTVFNGIDVNVIPESHIGNLLTIWDQKRQLVRLGVVKPYSERNPS